MAALQTVQDIYNYVLQTIDLDSSDVPQTLIGNWLQEAFDDLIGDDVRWPFYEVGGLNATQNTETDTPPTSYSITLVPGQQFYALPTVTDLYNGFAANVDPNRITALQGPHWELIYASQNALESIYPPAFSVSHEPTHWSIWGTSGISLWPMPSGTLTIGVRGFREPSDFITLGQMGAYPDCPGDFHTALQQYCLALAWAQQSDLQQYSILMNSYEAAKTRLHKKYLRAPQPEALILNGGQVSRELPPYLRFPFDGPATMGMYQ